MNGPKKALTIAMAGGGTGGHVFPIRSLLVFLTNHPEYQSHIQKIYWCGEKNSLEHKVCKELEQNPILAPKLTFISVLSGKYRRETYRKSQLKNIPDFFLFLAGFFQSLYILLTKHIDVIFCKGGYVALPLVLAAALLHKKIIVHESDTHPGLVNKIASRRATTSFTGFDRTLTNGQTIGQILADDIVVDTIPELQSKTVILVVGGSQGSKRLYQNILHILEFTPELAQGYEFHIVLGLINEDMSSMFDKYPFVHTYKFLTQAEMGNLYNISDIAITRGGTTSLAEQKLYDLKQIIIPIPWTHDQYDNAKWYVRYHNDTLINQRDADFEQQLSNAIKYFKGFKKIRQNKDKKNIVAQAKKIIREALIEGQK